MFVCSPSMGQLVREGCSAGSWRAGLLPSLATWWRDAVVPGERGARPAPGFAVVRSRKLSSRKGHLPRRAGMGLNPQTRSAVTAATGSKGDGESGGSRNHSHHGPITAAILLAA